MKLDPKTKESNHNWSDAPDASVQPPSQPVYDSVAAGIGYAVRAAQKAARTVRRLIYMHGGMLNLLTYGVRLVRTEGIRGVLRRLRRVSSSGAGFGKISDHDYERWIARYDVLTPAIRQEMRKRTDGLACAPLFSIVVSMRDSDPRYLLQMIRSVREQIYANWELYITSDRPIAEQVRELLDEESKRDSRIKAVVPMENGSASEVDNSVLDLVAGDFVVLLGHHDLLSEHALFMVAQYNDRHSNARMFYSDEDTLTADFKRSTPYFKSDWNPELFLASNFFAHLAVYETSLIREAGGFSADFEDCRHYDLALRCVELAGNDNVIHIPHVLYHSRTPGARVRGEHEDYISQSDEAIRAVTEHLKRRGVKAAVSRTPRGSAPLRVRYECPEPAPLVSLLVPTRDGVDLLRRCLDSLLEKTSYPNYEIIVIDNGSALSETLDYFAHIEKRRNVRVLRDDSPFNFSALNNRAAVQANGDYLCLLNNDTEVITPHWLNEMVGLACQPENGAIGAALWYPNDRLQHGGVLTGLGGVAGHMHHMLEKGDPGYFGRALIAQNVSAVTAACLVVRKAVYDEVGGLDETLAVAFNDIDFCLRVRKAGYRNVWTPYAELYHYESATRGSDMTPEKYQRFSSEVNSMRQRWTLELENDPAYSPNLSLSTQVLPFSLAEPPRRGFLD
ncbi:glycosyltransferase family 2 protein [Trinickia soli]|uniref:glycosyltransferase family 2 protein n=1 Tax=Trinickia soli TaxID=380675 RepID=UPI002AA5CB4B